MATEKAKKVITWFFAISIIAIAVLFAAYYFSGSSGIPSENVLYYGEQCPHCKIVEEFMAENDVGSKMNITLKEVWANQTNRDEFLKVVEKCEVDPSKAGVPFLYTGAEENKTCYIGDTPIINFLSSELNLTSSS